ncbi:hypothetical protein P8C59_008196 [Phyllachora maydis]|uniref:Uncharacterized protein n=1 Tax=Phyllachora maydis TaxID=1825666 RepID=A0AAD9IB02_9PEZI|nr:hypothetical protein P8C59_008196 [Phyllachora maydis]
MLCRGFCDRPSRPPARRGRHFFHSSFVSDFNPAFLPTTASFVVVEHGSTTALQSTIARPGPARFVTMIALHMAAVQEGVGLLAREIVARTSPAALSTASTSLPSDAPSSVNPPSSSDSSNQSGGSNSSPLLFFVALGFGVVFTNLWIIVGVKYCFRYNARSRQLRLNEDGEPINMETIQRPHRRRREKKLMTMDEVNEKFPMLKYKTWVASRAQEGLPTSGGISAPASPAASLVDAEGVIPETKEKHNTEDQHTSELMGTSGDTCAICIDSLEDDDDADYYTPKPRPPPTEQIDGLPVGCRIYCMFGIKGNS